MNPTIPSGMEPLISGYGFTGPGGVLETEVAGGAPRVALDYDRGSQPFTVSLNLRALKFSVWTAFFMWSIRKGSISFWMDLNSGFGCAPHLVTMIPDSYRVTALDSRRTVVSFSVRAESQAYQLDEDSAQALIDIYEIQSDSTNDLFDRLRIFANIDTNVLNF